MSQVVVFSSVAVSVTTMSCPCMSIVCCFSDCRCLIVSACYCGSSVCLPSPYLCRCRLCCMDSRLCSVVRSMYYSIADPVSVFCVVMFLSTTGLFFHFSIFILTMISVYVFMFVFPASVFLCLPVSDPWPSLPPN